MQKAIKILLVGIYVFGLTLLAVWFFWISYAKPYINTYIDNYAKETIDTIKTDVKQTRNNSDLIIEMLNIKKDES